MNENTDPVRALLTKWREEDARILAPAQVRVRRTSELESALAQQPAAPSVEAVAWATPDLSKVAHPSDATAEYTVPLYAAPQQPAGVDEFADDRERLLRAFMMECGIIGAKEAGVNLARCIKAGLAAQQQGGTHERD